MIYMLSLGDLKVQREAFWYAIIYSRLLHVLNMCFEITPPYKAHAKAHILLPWPTKLTSLTLSSRCT